MTYYFINMPKYIGMNYQKCNIILSSFSIFMRVYVMYALIFMVEYNHIVFY
jgi:hypothetical protein